MAGGRGAGGGSYLQLGGLVEISGADALPDDVPVGAAGGQVHLLLHHDVLQLGAHLTHLHSAKNIKSFQKYLQPIFVCLLSWIEIR